MSQNLSSAAVVIGALMVEQMREQTANVMTDGIRVKHSRVSPSSLCSSCILYAIRIVHFLSQKSIIVNCCYRNYFLFIKMLLH